MITRARRKMEKNTTTDDIEEPVEEMQQQVSTENERTIEQQTPDDEASISEWRPTRSPRPSEVILPSEWHVQSEWRRLSDEREDSRYSLSNNRPPVNVRKYLRPTETRVTEEDLRDEPTTNRYEYTSYRPEINFRNTTGNRGIIPRLPAEWQQARISTVNRTLIPEVQATTPEAGPTVRNNEPPATDTITMKYQDLKDLLTSITLPTRASATSAAATDLPTFHGYTHEDPLQHLATCEERLQLRPRDLWKEAIAEKLRGDAEKWWSTAKSYIGEYTEFKRCFARKYADPHTVQELHYELVNKRQGPRESVEAFVSQKRLLARRLTPNMSERELVDLCLGLVHKELYRYFIDRRPNYVDDFIDIAAAYEKLDQPPPNNPAQRSAPKCRFCPGYHLHANCPELRRTRQGNATGATRNAEPNATSSRPRETNNPQ